jgi:hypothetical protein
MTTLVGRRTEKKKHFGDGGQQQPQRRKRRRREEISRIFSCSVCECRYGSFFAAGAR